jgi:hypothetical protein
VIRAIVLACLTILLAQGASAQSVGAGDIARRPIERRAVEAAIWGIPAVNYDLMLQEAARSAPMSMRSFMTADR